MVVNLCRSMYNIAGTYLKDQGLPNRSPWAHDVTGRYFGWLGVQAAGAPAHLSCVLMVHWLQSCRQWLPALESNLLWPWSACGDCTVWLMWVWCRQHSSAAWLSKHASLNIPSTKLEVLTDQCHACSGYLLLTLVVETGWPGYLGRLCLRGLQGLGQRLRVLRGDDSMSGVSDPLLPWGEEDEDVRAEREHLLEHGTALGR